MAHYQQKNITVTPEQVEFLKQNHGKINNATLAKMLGLTYNKTHNNLRVIGLVKPYKETPVVDFNEYFDIDKFGKLYDY